MIDHPGMPKPAVRLRLNQLVQFHDILTRTLIKAGLTAPQLSHLFATDLHGECIACATKISGEDILKAALATAPLSDFRLDQLRLGNCARVECQSHTYLVHIEGDYPVDWKAMGKILETLPKTTQAPVQAVDAPVRWRMPFWPLSRRMIIGAALGLVLVSAFLLLRSGRTGPLIPFGNSKPKYQVDPSSLHPPGR